MYGMKYTDEMKQFIYDNYKGISTSELAEKFNIKFGTQVSVSSMKSYMGNHKLRNGLDGRFEKGHKPHNKGMKMSNDVYEKVKHTMFRKGHIPQNHKPVGSERVNVDGYVEVKIEEPNKWKLKQRVIWEKEKGPIPKGSSVIFLDGNRFNFDINNLRCVTRAELLYFKQTWIE